MRGISTSSAILLSRKIFPILAKAMIGPVSATILIGCSFFLQLPNPLNSKLKSAWIFHFYFFCFHTCTFICVLGYFRKLYGTLVPCDFIDVFSWFGG